MLSIDFSRPVSIVRVSSKHCILYFPEELRREWARIRASDYWAFTGYRITTKVASLLDPSRAYNTTLPVLVVSLELASVPVVCAPYWSEAATCATAQLRVRASILFRICTSLPSCTWCAWKHSSSLKVPIGLTSFNFRYLIVIQVDGKPLN